MRMFENFLAALGAIAFFIALPAWSYVTAPRPFANVTGGVVVVDNVSYAGFESLACPPGRITTTKLGLQYGNGMDKNMDVTNAENILGYTAWAGPRAAYPFKNGFTLFKGYPRTVGAYIGAKYPVPVGTLPVQWTKLGTNETVPGPGTDHAISAVCGDFSPAARNCAKHGAIGGAQLFSTKMYAAPVNAGCVHVTGRDYYLNIRLTNPATASTNCGATTCQFGLQNNHTP
jgi:hypothetical protein